MPVITYAINIKKENSSQNAASKTVHGNIVLINEMYNAKIVKTIDRGKMPHKIKILESNPKCEVEDNYSDAAIANGKDI